MLGYRIVENGTRGRLHFNSGRPYTTVRRRQSVAEALTSTATTRAWPSFFQLDLRAERTWRFRTLNLQLIFDVLNSTYAREVFALVLSDTNAVA